MNDLINIKVIQKDFNGEKKRFVNARELYKWLGVGRDFSNWIKDRIDKYDFVEDLDYFVTIAKFGDGFSGLNNRKAQKLGLDLCPPEVGPNYRLQYIDQPINEYLFIGMKQISASDGDPDVFRLNRYDDGLWLDDYWTKPTSKGGILRMCLSFVSASNTLKF